MQYSMTYKIKVLKKNLKIVFFPKVSIQFLIINQFAVLNSDCSAVVTILEDFDFSMSNGYGLFVSDSMMATLN